MVTPSYQSDTTPRTLNSSSGSSGSSGDGDRSSVVEKIVTATSFIS
jgi:hypothetical protein